MAVDAFLKLWTQSDQTSERKMQKFLLTGLDKSSSNRAICFLKSQLVLTSAPLWSAGWKKWGYPVGVTATLTGTSLVVSGYLFGAAVTADTVKKVLRAGTILERASDRVQAKVTQVSGLTATVEAYGNTSLSSDSAAITWEIVSEVWSDYRDAADPRALDRVFREVGTQIHAETFEIPKSRQNTKYELVANETEHQIEALLGKLRRQIAMSVLRSRPYHDGSAYVYGNKTEESTMCGLLTWPTIVQAEIANTNVYVNKASAALTKDDLDSLAYHLWLDENANFNTGDWWIACHPYTHKYMHDWDISYRRTTKDDDRVGFAVDWFDAKIGKSFPIVSDPYFTPGVLQMINLAACSYGYYANDRLDRKEVATAGRYQQWLISFQTYGTVVRSPRQNIGMIYGLPTT